MSEERAKLIPSDLFAICESVHGNWHYHLYAKNGRPSESLCGAWTMWSGAPIDTWGFKPDHMPSSYCSKCEEIALANALVLPPDGGVTPKTEKGN